MQSPQYFDHQGIDVIRNTPEEIREAVEEMMARLDGVFEMTDQDRADVARYRALNDYPGIPTEPTPAATFLRRHRHLLE